MAGETNTKKEIPTIYVPNFDRELKITDLHYNPETNSVAISYQPEKQGRDMAGSASLLFRDVPLGKLMDDLKKDLKPTGNEGGISTEAYYLKSKDHKDIRFVYRGKELGGLAPIGDISFDLLHYAVTANMPDGRHIPIHNAADMKKAHDSLISMLKQANASPAKQALQ